MIPINPEATGDPDQTPVVYLGEEAGKALGIPPRTPLRREQPMADTERRYGICQECGRIFRLTGRGGVWTHTNGITDSTSPYYRQNCRGSGRDPKPIRESSDAA